MKGFVHELGRFDMQLKVAAAQRWQAKLALLVGLDLEIGAHNLNHSGGNNLPLGVKHNTLQLGISPLARQQQGTKHKTSFHLYSSTSPWGLSSRSGPDDLTL